MSFQNNLCDLRVLGGKYVTAIRARRTSPPTIPGSFGMAGPWNRDRQTGPPPIREGLATLSTRISLHGNAGGRDPFTMLMEMMKRLESNRCQTGYNYTAMWSDGCWRRRREA